MMVEVLKTLLKYFVATLKSKYKWVLILFLIWAYRVGFMPSDAGGFAKGLQIGCLVGMAYFFNKFRKNIFSVTYKHTNGPVKSIYILYLFATASALWSIMPFFSAYLALQNIVLLCGLVWMFSCFSSFENVEKGFLFFALMVIVFDALCWRIVEEPGTIFSHHLTNGSTSAMVISYCTAEWLGMRRKSVERKNLLKCVLLLALIFLVISTSSGANASAVFGVGVAVLLSGKIFLAAILLIGAAVLYFYQDLMDKFIYFIMPGKTKEAIESATGRQRLWDIMLELAAKKPWFGWGYACIERAATLTGRIQTPDAHNNYLGLYGSLGYIGSAIAYVSFAITLFYSWARRLRPGYKGIISAFCCALLNGYSYGFLAGKACNITVVFFALIALTYSYSRVPADSDSNIKP